MPHVKTQGTHEQHPAMAVSSSTRFLRARASSLVAFSSFTSSMMFLYPSSVFFLRLQHRLHAHVVFVQKHLTHLPSGTWQPHPRQNSTTTTTTHNTRKR